MFGDAAGRSAYMSHAGVEHRLNLNLSRERWPTIAIFWPTQTMTRPYGTAIFRPCGKKGH